ncbi:F-box only protein 25 [Lamellibrachia satsuma]|nr:F-box only protein 25 [Lamellibrachia satsuma]
MPFLGQDWRSPGEQWVRTTEGWERLRMWRLKLLENFNESRIARLIRLAVLEGLCVQKEIEGCPGSQPYVCIVKGTKEQKSQVSLSEAFSRLDMSGAVRDIHRCNYACKLLELLITKKLTTLSGTAQKVVFNIMECVLDQVMKTKNNTGVMQGLLKQATTALHQGCYNHLGSSSLWAHHMQAVVRMQMRLESIQLDERNDDGQVKLTDLPDDCIRQILLRLADHKDVVNAGLTDQRTFNLAEEQLLWKELCLFHFDPLQMCAVIRRNESMQQLSWKVLYLRLMKRYGLKDVYAEMLRLCRHCSALYWERRGHPCVLSHLDPKSSPVTPATFVQLFAS